MSRKQPDRVVIPAVQKLRIRYAKRGRLRFASHRDFQRALERALRRTEVPMAYSAGFSPHPKISYANAAPTGTASEAEYVEISVVERVEPAAIAVALDAALPDGFHVVEVVEATSSDFAARLEASQWRIRLIDVDEALVRSAVETFLAAEAVEVSRVTKDGRRTFDARSAVVALGVADAASDDRGRSCVILTAVVRNGSPTVRPDDLLNALRLVGGLEPVVPPEVTRLAQGPLELPDGVGDPFAADR